MQIIQQPFADQAFVVQKKVANQNEGGKEWQKIVNPFLSFKRMKKGEQIVIRC